MAAREDKVSAAWEAFRWSEGRGGAPEAVKRPRKFGVEAVTILPIAGALRLLDGFRRERGVADEAALCLARVVEVGEVRVVGVDDEGGAGLWVVGPDMALMI